MMFVCCASGFRIEILQAIGPLSPETLREAVHDSAKFIVSDTPTGNLHVFSPHLVNQIINPTFGK